MISTTGTSIDSYISWLRRELENKEWGEVSIHFTVCQGQVTDVKRGSIETDHFKILPKVGMGALKVKAIHGESG
jgi:hypothetical protein